MPRPPAPRVISALAAVLLAASSVGAVPGRIKNPEQAVAELSKFLGQPPQASAIPIAELQLGANLPVKTLLYLGVIPSAGKFSRPRACNRYSPYRIGQLRAAIVE